MFQSIGWLEIFVVIVVGIIVIGPEKLPHVIHDCKAAIYAARKAINNAKKEMSGEFGEEFDELRKPLAEVAKLRSMGPRAALTKALFDDDDTFLEDFSPQRLMESVPTAGQAHRAKHYPDSGAPQAQVGVDKQQPQPQPAPPPQAMQNTHSRPPGQAAGGFDWGQIM